MTTGTQPLLFMTVAATAGWLMTRAGLAKRMLEQRHRKRRCSACGRLDSCGCGKRG